MKDPAQAGYEKHSASFGINIEQPNGRNKTVVGPIPWNDLPAGERRRWKMVAQVIIDQQQANALTVAPRDVRAAMPTLSTESELFECQDCGAKMLKGENHDCAKVQSIRRKLGHRLPKDKQA